MRDDFAAASDNAIKYEEDLGDLRENFIIITKQLLADKKVQQYIVRTSMNEDEVHIAELAINLANEEFSEDNNDLKEAEQKIKEAKTKVASHKEALKNMRKSRGHAETSLYTRVENVLKTYGISKESYHGGQLAGNACRILVEKIGEIGVELYQVIMEHHTSPTLTAATVKSKVEDLLKIFGLIDAAFASLMAIDPNPSELATAEKKCWYSDEGMTEATNSYDAQGSRYGAPCH
jgi:FtsZ-binding cell division protein ZapB